MGFSQIKLVSLKNPTLSADKVGFSLIKPVYLGKPILFARADKMELSAHAEKDCEDGLPYPTIVFLLQFAFEKYLVITMQDAYVRQ